MSYTIDCIRWLLCVFNLIFSLCGLGIIIIGIIYCQHINEVQQQYQSEILVLLIGTVVIGIIIFVTAFFGLYSTVTGSPSDNGSQFTAFIYAGLLFIMLLIQVSFAIIATVKTNGFEEKTLHEFYAKEFDQYWTSNISRAIIDSTQFVFSCCGVNSPDDFSSSHLGMNGTHPSSCCTLTDDKRGCLHDWQPPGCFRILFEDLKYIGKSLVAIFLSITGMEIIGIIFSLCLINSIRNEQRRKFKA